jgi:hypothetical protein
MFTPPSPQNRSETLPTDGVSVKEELHPAWSQFGEIFAEFAPSKAVNHGWTWINTDGREFLRVILRFKLGRSWF